MSDTYTDRQHCAVCGKEHHWNEDQANWWCIDLYRNYTSMCPEDMAVICVDCVPKVRESLMKIFPKWQRDWSYTEKAKDL